MTDVAPRTSNVRASYRSAPTGCRSTPASRSPAARDVVPYLAALGVGTCYTSPYFTAAPGSTHGYDVCEPQRDQPGARRRRRRIASFIERRRSARAAATSSTSCRTTWASARAATRGGTTCSRTARARRRRSSSTSTGRRSRRSCTRSCCCRSSATSTAACSSAASCSSQFHDGALALRYFDHELPINPRAGAARATRSPSSR